MTVYETNHPRWGSNFANQTYAKAKRCDIDGTCEIEVPETYTTFWRGKTKTRMVKKWVAGHKIDAPDDCTKAVRVYRHRCGIINVVTTRRKKSLLFTIFLDGHVASDFTADEIVIRFAPDELTENDGNPIADIRFEGIGSRYLIIEDYYPQHITCTFANREQFEQYFFPANSAAHRAIARSIVCKGVTYRSSDDGSYRSEEDGSALPWLLAAYLLLSQNEQQAFAAEHPEVQQLLDDAPDGDQSNEGGGSESGGSDDYNVGENTDTDSGSSDTFSAGGSE